MKIDCISDLHGYQPELEGGDLLIIAGDITATDNPHEYGLFQAWLFQQDYRKIVIIAGNHDGYLEKEPGIFDHPITYLCDSGTEFEGLKVWGSPWTPTFSDWHFMKQRGAEIKAMWDLIPQYIDILITHGPPKGVCDKVHPYGDENEIEHVGCKDLMDKYHNGTLRPKLHVFGHIHECGGQKMLIKHSNSCDTLCVNASIMNEHYQPVNKPVRVIL